MADIPRQINARRGFSVSYRGKTLLSAVDPIGQAERIVDTAVSTAAGTAARDRTLYFCPSPLYGYGLEKLLSKLEKNSAILCIELDEQLHALSLREINAGVLAHPLLRLTGIADPGGLCNFVRSAWGSRTFRRVEVLRLTGGWRLDEERYEALAETLRQNIALDWANAMTLLKLGRLYIRNAIRNLSRIPQFPSVSGISFGDDPALVLGAGPSLDGLLDDLKLHFGDRLAEPSRRPFRILCVDTCLGSLRARNIRPDLVIALESQHWNLRDFTGLGCWQIPVVMDLSALPATADAVGGRGFLFFTPWTDLHFFKRLDAAGLLPETFPPLGSVGLSAAAIALRISSGPVITGGIDFSFTIDSYHARSAPGHLEKLRRQNRLRSILNADAAFGRSAFAAVSKNGLPVRSNPAMRGYRDLFEREFSGGTRLFDVSGSGLPLGIKIPDNEEAFALLGSRTDGTGGRDHPALNNAGISGAMNTNKLNGTSGLAQKTAAFINGELKSLILLKAILTGEKTMMETHGESLIRLEELLETCDYLWSHFPDCAATGGRRPAAADTGFLKRVRAEIDPFIKLFELALREMED
ncbi:MAG: DUF115 domain-containing protein [Treponema sp.]|jgi:hypothetical protein|nr:DUF115 domain-containing protein [Treponema sp.]